MKKSMIALIISVIFLVMCMFLVVKTRNDDKTITNDMTVDYVDVNYEIDLYDDIKENKILLDAKAKYIGNEEIKEIPSITLQTNCSYIYEDADQQFTDLLTDKLIISNTDKNLIGHLELEINRDTIDSYSCSYKIIETTGKYIKK